MPNEPFWLTANHIREINRTIVTRSGEEHILLDAGLLESACARPINRWYYENERDPAALAVSILFAICRNHPFLDGNKRTGLVSAIVFLQVNGYIVSSPDDPEELAERIVSVITGGMDEAEFVAKFGVDIEPIDTERGFFGLASKP